MTQVRRPRLSSLLVRLGYLTVPQVKDALALQVVRGGGLDTVVLEEFGIAEEVLLALRCWASGLAAAGSALWQQPEPQAAALVPRERAEALGLCPLAVSAEGVVLGVSDTTDADALVELAQQLDRRLVVYAATELQVVLGRSRLYQDAAHPRRYAGLLAARAAGWSDAPAVLAPDAAQASVLSLEPTGPAIIDPLGVEPPKSQLSSRKKRRRGADKRAAAEDAATPPPQVTAEEASAAAGSVLSLGHNLQPLDSEAAALLIAQAGDRDTVLLALLRAVRAYVPDVHAYALQQEDLIGRFAMNERALDAERVRRRRLSVRLSVVVSRAVLTGEPYIGPTPTDEGSLALLQATELFNRHLVVIPIRVLHRTVCLILGHGADPLSPAIAEPLGKLALLAGQALTKLIANRKRITSSGIPLGPPPSADRQARGKIRTTLPHPYVAPRTEEK